MFFELSKILRIFLVSPLTWLFVLFGLSFLLRSRRWRRACRVGCVVMFLFFSSEPVLEWVKQETVGEAGKAHMVEGKRYRVAIVLGGFGLMSHTTGQLYHEGSAADRLWEAVRLWRTRHVERILISGDACMNIKSDGQTTAPLFLDYMEQMGVPRSVFILEQHAKNTRENATLTAEMLRREGISPGDCLLITTATHMRRSLGCFRRVGFATDWFPVHPCEVRTDREHNGYYPQWRVFTQWEELLNEWVGLCAYRVAGYI